ncbi:uncharacterized protein METZ01_LOCUS171238 [marine metagenome]|uniref:DUF1737 domain-containing protein n=1 Tax=marine metagenome TaxID=408172 RepID=A0A382BXQ7_9ZZZZ|tara:strand:+ start:1120 stop:1344 length:225 start_codon:yes stop_codon:yes gene_type:complete
MKYAVVVAEKMHKKEEFGVINWPGWDKPCLIEQVQMRIDTGWAPLGGVSYGEHEAFSEKVWAQSMIKEEDSEEE